MIVPAITEEYAALAQRRAALFSTKNPHAAEVYDQMEGTFAAAFGFAPDKGRIAEKIYYRYLGSSDCHVQWAFDHKSFFRRGESAVIVSQPYDVGRRDMDALDAWAAKHGVEITYAPDWAFYYPGKATLLLATFSRAAVDSLEQSRPPSAFVRAGRRRRCPIRWYAPRQPE